MLGIAVSRSFKELASHTPVSMLKSDLLSSHDPLLQYTICCPNHRHYSPQSSLLLIGLHTLTGIEDQCYFFNFCFLTCFVYGLFSLRSSACLCVSTEIRGARRRLLSEVQYVSFRIFGNGERKYCLIYHISNIILSLSLLMLF